MMALQTTPKFIEEKEIETIEYEIAEQDGIDYEDLDLLARLINAECGASWCCDNMLYYTGSVVLNRVESDDFPDSLYDVIYQDGQYAVVSSGTINKTPNIRSIHAAEDLLVSGSCLPDDVIFQSNFIQGEIYKKVQNMYFCKG